MSDADARRVPPINLVPMPLAVYRAWVERAIREYAEGHVAAGNWPAETAIELARAQFEQLLPDGPATEGQELWSIQDSTGGHVGILWVGPRPNVPDALWIYDIETDPEARGHGYAQAALEALHLWALERGWKRVGLHVFGSNEVAQRLYRRTGYVATDITMEKAL